MGEYDHSVVQRTILVWFHPHDKQWQTRTIQEQRTRLNADMVRIPDVSVWARSVPVEPVFTRPQLVVVEVLSPEDRHSRVQERIDDYRQFQVPSIWVVDPERRIGLGLLEWRLAAQEPLHGGRFAGLSRSRGAFPRTGRRRSLSRSRRYAGPALCRSTPRSFPFYNERMAANPVSRRRPKTPPPGETGQEALYLRSLSDRQVIVDIKLRDGQVVRGWIEYFDDAMLRLTRDSHPNLFIYKSQIRSITEVRRRFLLNQAVRSAPEGRA